MSIVKTWKITSLHIMENFTDFQSVVAAASWQLKVTYYNNDGLEVSVATRNETTYISPPDGIAPFVPFNSLTESQVLEWVKNVLGYKVQEYEILAARHAVGQVTPENLNITTVDVPWA